MLIARSFVDCYGNPVDMGEIWYDRSGNECYYRANGTLSVTTVNNEPSLTIQSEKDSCDINKIVSRFSNKRKDIKRIAQDLIMTPYVRSGSPQYGDFASVPLNYQDALEMVQNADSSFQELPSALRKRFDNNPGLFLEFIADEANRDEAVKLGLVPAPQSQEKAQGEGTPPSKEGG